MNRIHLIHGNAAKAEESVAKLRAAGYEVACEAFEGPVTLRKLRDNPPRAVVIDLSRRPSLGRDVAVFLRHHKSTRRIPIVFVAGDREKVARIKEILPDAVYTAWSRIRSSLKRAINNPPQDPVAARSLFAGYSGTPLPKKLGIKANTVVALINAPPSFTKTLGKLPDGVTLRKQARGRCNQVVWFTKSRKDLERRIGKMASALAAKGSLWIAWPKKASGVASDLSQNEVRKIGLAAGLVDYKICAIDATWSGLRFARREAR